MYQRPAVNNLMQDDEYNEIIKMAEEVDIPEWMAEAFAFWCNYFGKDHTNHMDAGTFIDQYRGDYDDIDDFCDHEFGYIWEMTKDEYNLSDDERAQFMADTFNNGHHLLGGHYAFCTL